MVGDCDGGNQNVTVLYSKYLPFVFHFDFLQAIIRAALDEAFPNQQNPSTEIAAICFTKGPGMYCYTFFEMS